VTSGAATPMPDAPAGSTFALLEQAASDAVDALRGVAFLAPSGVLDLPLDGTRLTRLRIEQYFAGQLDAVFTGALGGRKNPSCIRDLISGRVVRPD